MSAIHALSQLSYSPATADYENDTRSRRSSPQLTSEDPSDPCTQMNDLSIVVSQPGRGRYSNGNPYAFAAFLSGFFSRRRSERGATNGSG
jgi:hypothetical protein